MARPMPRPAPVTMVTLPSNLPIFSLFLFCPFNLDHPSREGELASPLPCPSPVKRGRVYLVRIGAPTPSNFLHVHPVHHYLRVACSCRGTSRQGRIDMCQIICRERDIQCPNVFTQILFAACPGNRNDVFALRQYPRQ